MFETRLLSSLSKIFPDRIQEDCTQKACALNNEPYSFQIAYRLSVSEKQVLPFYLRVESPLPENAFRLYKEAYVPVVMPVPYNGDSYFDSTAPGLFPDLLLPRGVGNPVENDGVWRQEYFEKDEKQPLHAIPGTYYGLWFVINEDRAVLPAGDYPVTVTFYSAYSGEEIGRVSFSFTVLGASLDETQFINTSWFHCDCLADLYHVPALSDRHYEIMESFIRTAARNGMNMILLPAFTPPLDTPVGKERMTVQLVSVEADGGTYRFDFSGMERFITLCLSCGILYFEHSHLFTQWGARAAPKIMAHRPGETEEFLLFGWDTDAKGEAYSAFLSQYLSALMAFLKAHGWKNRFFFHVSDEPQGKHMEYYSHAKQLIKDGIEDCPSGDALSGFEFFENGAVDRPIVDVASKDMDRFIADCPDFWVYYTGIDVFDGLPNRLISTTAARNRMLGVKSYYANASGFLHWGYNYYYDALSHGLFNPTENPSSYRGMPGTSYIVYPSADGTALPSMRMKVFYEGINDYRALMVLESLCGREAVKALTEQHFGALTFRTPPHTNQLLAFREAVNEAIRRALAGEKPDADQADCVFS